MTSAELRQLLAGAGLKSTAPRRVALDVLLKGGHFSVADVFEEVKRELPRTSLQAMYGVLADLSEVGLIRRIEPTAGPAYFEARVGDNHHHLVCESCGRIEDVSCVVGQAPCLTPSEDHGFEISLAEVTFRGLCPGCMDTRR